MLRVASGRSDSVYIELTPQYVHIYIFSNNTESIATGCVYIYIGLTRIYMHRSVPPASVFIFKIELMLRLASGRSDSKCILLNLVQTLEIQPRGVYCQYSTGVCVYMYRNNATYLLRAS